jgi:hypothetical protein
MEHHSYLNDLITIVIQTQESGRHCLKNTVSLAFQGTRLTVFIDKDTIWAFKQTLEFYKLISSIVNLNSFPAFKDFSDEKGGNINKMWYLEVLNNAVNQYIATDQCMMLQNHAWVKHCSKCNTDPWALM